MLLDVPCNSKMRITTPSLITTAAKKDTQNKIAKKVLSFFNLVVGQNS
jgi:hypothetical protein